MEDATRDKIEALLKAHRIVLFMKGTKHFPQCGFSAQVASVLQQAGAEYHDVNVLLDPELRQGIKDYASWPTVPQLYVDGNFIGGCDIVTDLFESGELEKLVAG